METTDISKQNKSMMWKAAIVIASPIVSGWLASALFLALFFPIYFHFVYLFWVLTVIVEIFAVRFAIAYVGKRTSLTKADVSKIITWYAIVDVVLYILVSLHGVSFSGTVFDFIELIMVCYTIHFFSKKFVS